MKNSRHIQMLAYGLLLALASCTSDPETHELTPVVKSIMLYADQTVDSLFFYTFDSWTVTPQEDWISIEGDTHLDIDYDYTKRYLCRVIVSVEPNTTGETRRGTVHVQSHDYSYAAPLVQLGMLDIRHPAYIADPYLDNSQVIPKVARFELTDSAHWTSDSISFIVENNWDLTFVGEAPAWLSLDKTTGLRGRHRVQLTLEENTSKEYDREAILRLTSGKVSNIITVRQLRVKKNDEEEEEEKEENKEEE